jgi:predicted transposase YdaD
MRNFKASIASFEPEKQEVVMEIVTSWQLQGRQEGRLELILRQLNRKLGSLAPELEARIHQLTANQLENLAEALLDFAAAENLVAWLDDV